MEQQGIFTEPLLKQVLLSHYGFADKRNKKLANVNFFAADGSEFAKRNARGGLFPWFTTIGVTVVNNNEISIRLGKALPTDRRIEEWFVKRGIHPNGVEARDFTVRRGEQAMIGELAKLIDSIRRPFPEKSWAYEVPDVAAKLEKLERALNEAWDQVR